MRILVRAIGWVVVVAFAVTFSVTIVALTTNKLTIAPSYLKGLFVSLIIEVISASFFLFYKGIGEESSSRMLDELKNIVAKQDGIPVEEVKLEMLQRRLMPSTPCEDCGKDYRAIIYWDDDYAQTLFNFEGRTPNFQAVNPCSVGHLHYYRTRGGCYKGYSTWETRNGERTYSQVVVIHSEFKFESPGKLKEICTNIVVRKQVVEFSYGPFTHYHMRFTEWSDTALRGKMLLIQNGNGGEDFEVGDVVLELD